MYHGEVKQYNKEEAVKVIMQGAKLYRDNLENKELLFLCKSPSKNISYYKVDFNSWNYLHFTGVETSLKATAFYRKALNNTLKASDFKYKDELNTFKKLDILNFAMSIMYNARMIGIFNYGIKINADLGVGNISYAMAIAKRENVAYYFPMGILKGDTRGITNNTSPVIAVLSRNFIKENIFDKVTYISKNINTIKLHFPQDLISLITDEALLQIKPNIDLNANEKQIYIYGQ